MSEILRAPLPLPTSRDLSQDTYAEGPYHFHCVRREGMPASIKRSKQVLGNLGSDASASAPYPAKTAQHVLDAVKFRSQQLINDKKVIEDDAIVKFFKETIKQTPRISYLQPGSNIMSMCKVKAEFWLLHLDIAQREQLHGLCSKICEDIPQFSNSAKTVGITIPFRFKEVPGLPAPFKNTIGLMNVELAKMKWGKNAQDTEKSQTVVEISVFSTSKPMFGGGGSQFSNSDQIDVQFVTDFGQYVKPSSSNAKKMKREDVAAFLEGHGFRSSTLKHMQLDGKELLRMFRASKDVDKLSRVFSMHESEVRRLINTLDMITRRATPEKYNKKAARGRNIREMKNTAEIEFLPFYKGVQVRFDQALSLEAEIRSTAEGVLNKVLDTMESGARPALSQILECEGTNQEWQKAFEKELDIIEIKE